MEGIKKSVIRHTSHQTNRITDIRKSLEIKKEGICPMAMKILVASQRNNMNRSMVP